MVGGASVGTAQGGAVFVWVLSFSQLASDNLHQKPLRMEHRMETMRTFSSRMRHIFLREYKKPDIQDFDWIVKRFLHLSTNF